MKLDDLGGTSLFSEPSPSFRLLLSCPFFGGEKKPSPFERGSSTWWVLKTPPQVTVKLKGGVQIIEPHGPVFQRITVNIATPFFLVVFFLEIYLGGSWWSVTRKFNHLYNSICKLILDNVQFAIINPPPPPPRFLFFFFFGGDQKKTIRNNVTLSKSNLGRSFVYHPGKKEKKGKEKGFWSEKKSLKN